MATWTPNQGGLSQILSVLRDSQSPNPQVQKQIHEYFQNVSKIPDFCNYLVYIFAELRNEPEYVRTCAGLVLKNNVKDYYKKLPKDIQEYIKSEILKCVGDPGQQVRRTAGSIITTICLTTGLKSWPSLVGALVQYLDSNDFNAVDGAFNTLTIICEDHPRHLDSEALGRPLNVLIPKFLQFFKSQNATFRKYAISCMNQFLTEMPGALLANMENFIQGIYYLANDPTPEVRRRVCRALTMLVEIRIDYLFPSMPQAIEYMLMTTQDKDESIALEACEFWNAMLGNPMVLQNQTTALDTKVATQILQQYLPRLVPLLLNSMVYTDLDLAYIGPEVDEDVPDNPQDIKPFIQKSRKGAPEGQLDDSDSDLEDDDAVAEVSDWTLRKCAASALDACSDVFGLDLLPVLLPLIQERLSNKDDWNIRETAVLALGAIAEGSMDGLAPHLPQLIPYLVTLLSDPQPLIRSITCWTLSRFSQWVIMQPDCDTYLRPIMIQFLNRMLDHNKKVQEAACSAFACLEEVAQTDLVPYLEPILKCLTTAFEKYQAKNLYILYDCIGTLADAVGPSLNRPEYISILMPPLTSKWNKLQDSDNDLLPLLECLTSVAAALGVGFQQYALPVFQRCLRLIEATLVQQQIAEQGQGVYPEIEFMISGLDLISGMAEGMQTSIESLVSGSNLASLLFGCMKDKKHEVLQSAFALCGDLAKFCIVHIQPMLHEYIPVLIAHLRHNHIAVCNNASWAIGEICMKSGEKIAPYVPAIMTELVALINKKGLNNNLLQNTAITIGRLGYVCPEILAPQLQHFVENWCIALLGVREDYEKESACRGLVKMIKLNPTGVFRHFVAVCDVIVSWDIPPPNDLREQFYQILHGFKNSMQPDSWQRYINSFPPHIVKGLVEVYQV